MKLTVSRNVHHSLEGVKFAYRFVQANARQHGKKLSKVRFDITSMTCGGQGYCGRAYPWRNRVLLRFAPQLPRHVHQYPYYQDMPAFELEGGIESIIYLTAHELGHLIGFPGGKHGEKLACNLGYKAVEAWRDRQYADPAILI
jgi:hypothetical protein